jgi:Golgi apparatus protein 1
VGIATSCKEDIGKVCASQKSQHGGGAVLKCLSENHDSLTSSDCQFEVARSTKMALFQYRKGAAMTRSCDADGESLCPDSFPNEPGANSLKKTGECLISSVEKIASPVCKKLVGIASAHEESEDTFEASLAQVTLTRISTLSRGAAGCDGTLFASSAGSHSYRCGVNADLAAEQDFQDGHSGHVCQEEPAG